MAATDLGEQTAFTPELYLSPTEQDLLLTALQSNTPNSATYSKMISVVKPIQPRQNSNPVLQQAVRHASSGNNNVYESPIQQTPGSATFGSGNMSYAGSPFLDYELDEGSFDWDLNGQQMIGNLPGTSTSADDEEGDLHDKRKNPGDEDADDDDGGGKRREGDDKLTKKPGRKPLTSEPTSKRKAQNRAAQRAFRERKERHLKELETKVDDLEKASESANHENGLLRAQVDRLQTELKEYRTRISLNSNTLNTSPSQTMGQAMSSKTNWDINNNFQFEFPTFGGENSATKYSQAKRPATYNDGIVRQTSYKNSSPKSLASPTRTPSQPKTVDPISANGMDHHNGLYSPTMLQTTGRNGSADQISSTSSPITHPRSKSGSSDIAAQNMSGGGSGYTTASPSISSLSQNGLSSCATTPEQSADIPEQHKGSESAYQPSEAFSTVSKSFGGDFQGIDWLASQNGGAFDPVLFGDYRDPQESIMNSDFGGFFSDAFPLADFGSPLTTPHETNLPPKKDLMKEIEDRQEGREPEINLSEEAPKQFLTCNMLWDRVQRSERVQSGEADMDDLCSQLKSKAKCSGSGAVIDQKDVDAILGPAPDVQKGFLKMFS